MGQETSTARETNAVGNTAPIKFSGHFHMRIDDEFLSDLDDLRAQERPLLSRADYLRKLVADAKKSLPGTAKKGRK
jgi:hypothetical protein